MYILYTYFVYGCRFNGRNCTYAHWYKYTYMVLCTRIIRVMYIIRINILMNINRKIMS